MSSPSGLTFEELLANLSLGERPSPPHSPSAPISQEPPSLPSSSPTHTTPHPPSAHPSAGTLYYYESPGKSGFTSSWATAGAATQGVGRGTVVRVQRGPKKKKAKAAAYVVFVGTTPGVYGSWPSAEACVSGISGAIHRGYPTLGEARAAFAYAYARRWIRSTDFSPAPIPNLPLPIQDDDVPNPLHGTEKLDSTWYVVYRGIQPGVYRSLLEASLNTVGVPHSLHEAVVGREAALRAYRLAVHGEETSSAPAPDFTEPHVQDVPPPVFRRSRTPPPPFA
ncbi:hypothetical protein B0H11DRAFT_2237752 [Mycena galericulata]|nr:hypothetical protein B0H11DRAFT_2237752 [Mycena galericulata]